MWRAENMRNNTMKDLKCTEWKHSKFLFGKPKVMAVGIGKTSVSEVKPNISKMNPYLKGDVGLLFTSTLKGEVVDFFKDFQTNNFARSGNEATETVELVGGPLENFAHSMEPHLRSLGLPTRLVKGTIMLTNSYNVCTKGETVIPEQFCILKLLDTQMSAFILQLQCVWSKDGCFEALI